MVKEDEAMVKEGEARVAVKEQIENEVKSKEEIKTVEKMDGEKMEVEEVLTDKAKKTVVETKKTELKKSKWRGGAVNNYWNPENGSNFFLRQNNANGTNNFGYRGYGNGSSNYYNRNSIMGSKHFRNRNPSSSFQNFDELYRVKVSGLPRFYSNMEPLLIQFKKMLVEELNLPVVYVRSPKKGNSWLYLTFSNQADQIRALNTLKHYIWKDRTLVCTLVTADVLKRKTEDGTEIIESKKPKLVEIPAEERMLMATIPFHSVSYEEQLSKKNEEARCLLKRLTTLLERRNHLLSGWIDEQAESRAKFESNYNLPFKLDAVKPSPIIDEYRNKCEFHISTKPGSSEPMVGCRVDSPYKSTVECAPPDSLRHLPKPMIQVVKEFEKYLVSVKDDLPVMEGLDKKGLWQNLLVRTNMEGHLMLVAVVLPSGADPEGQLARAKATLVRYFTEGDGSAFPVTSIYFLVYKDKVEPASKPVGVWEHVWGADHIKEHLLGLEVRVTPGLYFQPNSHAAQSLYEAVAEVAQAGDDTSVLDICCGSGGMGLVLAKHCKEVLGIEVMDKNLEDARNLAEINKLTNCEFIHGKIDDVFPTIAEKVKGKKVVPILDPPRIGMSQKMILCLRKLEEADRLVYVCSNHKLPLKNLLDLATVDEGQFAGSNPFVPTRVIPVDMTPHTLRCELVILCERLDLKKIPPPTREPKKDEVKKPASNSYAELEKKKKRSLPSYWQFKKPKREFGMGVSVRDSLYPPPLREALYRPAPTQPPHYASQGPPPYRRNNPIAMPRLNPPWDYHRHHQPSDGYKLRGGFHGFPQQRLPRYDPDDLSRYTDFRRDFEDAIDSSYRPGPSMSQLMERESYRPGPPLPQLMDRELFRPPLSIAAQLLEREQRAYRAGLNDGLTSTPRTSHMPPRYNSVWRSRR